MIQTIIATKISKTISTNITISQESLARLNNLNISYVRENELNSNCTFFSRNPILHLFGTLVLNRSFKTTPNRNLKYMLKLA
jgi:hypothetical protein